jgi:hypothetical protein
VLDGFTVADTLVIKAQVQVRRHVAGPIAAHPRRIAARGIQNPPD